MTYRELWFSLTTNKNVVDKWFVLSKAADLFGEGIRCFYAHANLACCLCTRASMETLLHTANTTPTIGERFAWSARGLLDQLKECSTFSVHCGDQLPNFNFGRNKGKGLDPPPLWRIERDLLPLVESSEMLEYSLLSVLGDWCGSYVRFDIFWNEEVAASSDRLQTADTRLNG
ncbi:MAG: hypothetical protein ABSC50_12930 [Candidatus Bathyarchaeia archaeon]